MFPGGNTISVAYLSLFGESQASAYPLKLLSICCNKSRKHI